MQINGKFSDLYISTDSNTSECFYDVFMNEVSIKYEGAALVAPDTQNRNQLSNGQLRPEDFLWRDTFPKQSMGLVSPQPPSSSQNPRQAPPLPLHQPGPDTNHKCNITPR